MPSLLFRYHIYSHFCNLCLTRLEVHFTLFFLKKFLTMSTSDAPDGDESDYDVEFSSEQANNAVICKRCSKVFPSGTKLRLMHSKMHGSDRFFCPKCFDYYRNKKTTIRRTPQTQGPGTSNQGMHKSSTQSHFAIPHFSLLLKQLVLRLT